MPPEPIQGRPLFRPEAIQHRLVRHFGEISLLRPLPLRLVTLCPLLLVALLGLGLSRIDLQSMFVALVEAAPPAGQGLVLSLEPSAAEQLRPGDTLEFRFAGSAERSRGIVSTLITRPCSRESRAFLEAASRQAEGGCLHVELAPDPALPFPPAPLPLKVQVWTPPQKYLDHLLRG
ncbi:hypothetical protein DRW03_13590 [Corallococcus sp. H22C18031201]|uniref:hypothetical protein n=1 Tax=Citreicoccus inhibens TaxID=2849499 RepID=UPI000E76FE05|nr:hypothetical protein [Citreicoccus inhibens]MBU8900576.1 hypothetical protein [Citreicoccus inhibens]RJS23322.1 hypothetical protein DRW03_13590 [Corallococcus sp. H22C18031201]